MNVPVELLRPRIERYCIDRGISLEEFGASMGYGPQMIQERMARHDYFSIWMADRIICKLGLGLFGWRCDEKLREIYEFKRVCGNEKCDEEFYPSSEAQIYCSHRCRTAAHRATQRRRDAEKRRKRLEEQRLKAPVAKKKTRPPEELERIRERNRIAKRRQRARLREQRAA
jgi:hypothetical protein